MTVDKVIEEIDAIHRELARLSVDQLRGNPSALNTLDILESHPVPLRPKTVEFLKKALKAPVQEQDAAIMERVLFGCMDLAVEEQTASLGDMLTFYMERGRMHVSGEKIPALEVVPWLQSQPDFVKREQMQKEMSIFLKGIVNPMLLGILELTVRAVTEKFGFENYARFAEEKKKVSFREREAVFDSYLDKTKDAHFRRIVPWVEETIGRPMEGLSRYHALYLLRIRRFDDYFTLSGPRDLVARTFRNLGLDIDSRSDVVVDVSNHASKNPNGICIGVEIPGEVYVLMKPVGGLIDVETLLHEMGHAFFLSNVDSGLPIAYRRLYRSASLDETFAFLFMGLTADANWLTAVAGMPSDEAEKLADLSQTKRLCLIRRYIGKFLAEKELHENKNIKDSGPYCRHLQRATGFIYEPEGYLIDMEPDFYSLDYLNAWAGANVLEEFLRIRFGSHWFESLEAGMFLKEMATAGRRDSLQEVLVSFCGEPPRLPDFSGN